MGKRLYELKVSGTELHITDDPQILLVSELGTSLPDLKDVRADSDTLRAALAVHGLSLPGATISSGLALADFDDALDDEIERLSDISDYPGYSTRVENLTVLDGEWVLPAAVDSFHDERVGEEAILSIDGINSTWWEADAAGSSIVWQIKPTDVGLPNGYVKRYTKIRLRSTSGDQRAQLQGVEIRLANALGNIDDADSLRGTNVNFTHAGNDWIEFVFTSPRNARFLKLDGFASLHATDIRIREVQLFAITQNHDK